MVIRRRKVLTASSRRRRSQDDRAVAITGRARRRARLARVVLFCIVGGLVLEWPSRPSVAAESGPDEPPPTKAASAAMSPADALLAALGDASSAAHTYSLNCGRPHRDIRRIRTELDDRLGEALDSLASVDRLENAVPGIGVARAVIRSARADLKGDGDCRERAMPLGKPSLAATIETRVATATTALQPLFDTAKRLEARERAIVVSGGVSMGSYQAGYLYYYLHALRFYGEALGYETSAAGTRFQIATGASAGSINAFLAAVSGCLEPEFDPEESLFFKTWIDLGLETLIPSKPAPASDGILAEAPIEDGPMKMVRDLWDAKVPHRWTSHECAAQLGFTATRLAPRRVDLLKEGVRTTRRDNIEALTLDRMTEKFLLTMKGDPHAPPTFKPKRFDGMDDQLYPTLGEGLTAAGSLAATPSDIAETSPTQVIGLLRASSAFPLAFRAKPLSLTTWYRTASGYLRDFEAGTLFVDGGFVDNTPLRIAQKLLAANTEAAGARRTAQVLVLMSGARSWKPEEKGKRASNEGQSVLGQYLPFVLNFLSTSSDGALIDVFEDEGDHFGYDIPMREFPVAADPLGHFFAFLEHSFRLFDFYAGMVDAEELFAGQVGLGRSPIPFHGAEVGRPSATLECFREYRRRARAAKTTVPPAGPACANVDPNLKAILLASAQRRMTVVPGDDDFEAFVGALNDNQFKYQDLDHGHELDLTGVALALRGRFDSLRWPFASAQPPWSAKAGVVALAPEIVDLWWYRARPYVGLGIPGNGNMQIAASLPLQRWQAWSLRFNADAFIPLLFWPKSTDLMIGGKTTSQLHWPVQVGVGLATERTLGRAMLVEFGLRGLLQTDYFWDTNTFAYLRSGVGTNITAVAAERVYASLVLDYFFGDCGGKNTCILGEKGYGDAFPALIPRGRIPNLTPNFILGVRALW